MMFTPEVYTNTYYIRRKLLLHIDYYYCIDKLLNINIVGTYILRYLKEKVVFHFILDIYKIRNRSKVWGVRKKMEIAWINAVMG